MKKVAILGSTGSIGTQTLDVIRNNSDKLKVVSLVAFSNAQKIREQAEEFEPNYVALISQQGKQCLIEAVQNCDVAVVATSGIAALECVLYCLDNGIEVALANKEVLVCAGELVMSRVKNGAKLVPIDSEHSAIMQCLAGKNKQDLHRILLTASGGPFYDSDIDFSEITAKDALQHPNWNMGTKITVDSATMMNKALEVVEAHWLFDVPLDKIQIVVHRQSIVHSMVEWQSGSVIAQLANPNMKLPIQLALLGESPCIVDRLNFDNMLSLTFQQCDYSRFPCAKLAYEMEKYPPLCTTVMNAANDICVESFLKGKLSFDSFYKVIMRAVQAFAPKLQGVSLTVENIESIDSETRKFVLESIEEGIC